MSRTRSCNWFTNTSPRACQGFACPLTSSTLSRKRSVATIGRAIDFELDLLRAHRAQEMALGSLILAAVCRADLLAALEVVRGFWHRVSSLLAPWKSREAALCLISNDGQAVQLVFSRVWQVRCLRPAGGYCLAVVASLGEAARPASFFVHACRVSCCVAVVFLDTVSST